jgi:hypothetical protein
MTVKDYVNIWKKPAYIFSNGFTSKCMFFIPICEYDEVVINPDFNAFSYSQIIKDGKVVCDIKDLIHKYFLLGSDKLFIVPIEFDDNSLPEENVVYPDENS